MTMTSQHILPDQIFKTQPFAHQLQGLTQSRDAKVYALLMEMGTGKTKVIIDNASYLFGKGRINGMIVVAPKSICRNWSMKEIPVHLPDAIDRRVVLWGPRTKKLQEELEQLSQVEPLKLHVLVINIEALNTDDGYEMVEKFLRGHDTLMVVDESTIIKNFKADRTKIAIKLGKLAKYRRIMTGTPVTQSPLDVWSQFEFLESGCLGSYNFYGFRAQYAHLAKKRVNGRMFDVVVGYQRLEKLQEILKEISFRALKRDCLDLPEKIYEVRYVEMTAEQKSYYKSLRTDALAKLTSGEVVAAPLVLTQLLRLRQCLCNIAPVMREEGEMGPEVKAVDISKSDPRADEVMNILEEAGDQSVIIWANFIPSIKKLIHLIGEKYGHDKVGAIYGDIKSEQRNIFVERFQGKRAATVEGNSFASNVMIDIPEAEQIKYIVMQPRTGGYGLTLTKASLVIYHDQDWSLEVRQQSEDRAHRIGQLKNVTYIDLIAHGTVDEKIREALMQKKNLADMVTGDTLRELLT